MFSGGRSLFIVFILSLLIPVQGLYSCIDPDTGLSNSPRCWYPGCMDRPCSDVGEYVSPSYCTNGFLRTRCKSHGDYGEQSACATQYSGSAYSVHFCPDPPACTVGKYQRHDGKNGGASGACQPCEAGKYAKDTGATACQSCEPGKYMETTSASACTLCLAGKYSGATGAFSASVCQSCDAGKYSGAIGSNSSATCTSCPAGTYSPSSGVVGDKYTCTYACTLHLAHMDVSVDIPDLHACTCTCDTRTFIHVSVHAYVLCVCRVHARLHEYMHADLNVHQVQQAVPPLVCAYM